MFKFASKQLFSKLLLASLILFLPLTSDDEYERTSKQWRSKSGSKELIADFVKLEKNKLYLRKADGSEVTTVLENLFPDDAGKAIYLAGEFDDLKQLKAVRSTLDAFAESPENRLEEFLVAHRESERAPYAGLAASIVVAKDQNDAEKAIRLISEVISRIERVREYRPERHTNTLIAAYNNKAIIHMKEMAFSKACVAFTHALEQSEDHEVGHVVHNATLVLGWASEKGSTIEIANPIKKKLTSALQSRSDAMPGPNLTSGRLCYAFNFDLALGKGVYEARINDFAVVEDNCLMCNGDGLIDCRNCKDGIDTYQVMETVGIDPIRKEPLVRKANREKPCDNCSSYWNSVGKRGLLPCPNPECDNGKVRLPRSGR